MSKRAHVLSGIDSLSEYSELLKGKRVGLMTNPTGITHDFESTIDIIHRDYNLTALFAVEHGIRGDAQAGAAIDTTVDPITGVTVYSAYGKNDHFTDEMLDAFDVLVFDIQDVGARFYTYLYSLSYAMEACARGGKSMIVCDRVNPIGGIKRTGTILDRRFASFVGDYELPTQYGLTIGEYALYVKDYLKLDVELTIAPLKGWRRDMYLDDTDLPWVTPSPNCQNLDAALCYIGTCVFEGTNISEGRGTTNPFQVVGAPFLDQNAVADEMNAMRLEGLYFRPTTFVPTFSKHEGKLCRGVQVHVVDREKADVFAGGLLLLDVIRKQAGDGFEFLSHDGRYFLDKLLGIDSYRKGEKTAWEVIEEGKRGIAEFDKLAKKYLLYR